VYAFSKMKKLLVVCGLTATGKTALAVELAKKFNGEIVSADSRQAYREMDVGTGKDLPANSNLKSQMSNLNLKSKNLTIGFYEVEGVKIWLYDIAEPDYRFSVADYVKCSEVVIKDIWKRGKLPILVGGTGFYIKALIDGIETLSVPPDWELREKLRNLEVKKLREILKKIAPERLEKMNESDRNNPRRLIRAIEITEGYQISNIKYQKYKLKIKKILIVGLRAPYKFLYQRIDQRVEERVKQGIIKEIKNLLKKGYNWENSALGTTIGYKEWGKYFESSNFQVPGSRLKDEIIQKWKYAEHAYARRQMTWFKKDKRIHWFDISQKKWQDKIEVLVGSWINGKTKNS